MAGRVDAADADVSTLANTAQRSMDDEFIQNRIVAFN
jgi:hypothetical protein